MSRVLKSGIGQDRSQAADTKVRQAVESILDEIEGLVDSLPLQTVEDLRFAQAQVRGFAEIQRQALRDVEAETLPGVILGHKEQADLRLRRYASTPS